MAFKHRPLDNQGQEIRLLQIVPVPHFKRHTKIELRVIHGRFDDLPVYRAISYAWGAAELCREVHVDTAALKVTANCHYALWQARSHFPGTYVWIDSICINQSDLEEKAIQVGMMGAIYSRALAVLACIGDTDHHVDTLLLWLVQRRTIERDRPLLYETAAQRQRLALRPPRIDAVPELTYRDHWEDWVALFRRPYWHRIWILQELALAREVFVLCGTHLLSWLELTSLYPISASRTRDVSGYGMKMADIRELVRGGSNSQDLSVLLQSFASSGCTDSRDRVFASIALVDWDWHRAIPLTPDYTKSNFELALDLARFLPLDTLSTVLRVLRINASHSRITEIVSGLRQGSSWPAIFAGADWRLLCTAPLQLIPLRRSSDRSAQLYVPYQAQYSRPPRSDQGPAWVQLAGAPDLVLFMCGSIPALVGNANSRAGDVLAPIGITTGTTDTYLVLRHSHGDLYDVIGQAISLFGYYPDICQSQRAHVSLKISVQEAIALIGQDIRQDCSDNAFTCIDTRLRVVTPAMANQLRAAHVVPESIDSMVSLSDTESEED